MTMKRTVYSFTCIKIKKIEETIMFQTSYTKMENKGEDFFSRQVNLIGEL